MKPKSNQPPLALAQVADLCPGVPERRTFLTVFKRAEENDGRTVEGYAAVFNSETEIGGWYTEIIEAGAFDAALTRSDCRALFNHDANHLLARQSSGTLSLDVDDKGLKYRFTAPNTGCGNDILEMMNRGDLKESSFAFTVKEQSWEEEKDEAGNWTYRRRIKEVDLLFDVSPVTYPAYADTTVAKRSFDAWHKADHADKPHDPDATDDDDFQKSAENRGYHADMLRLVFG